MSPMITMLLLGLICTQTLQAQNYDEVNLLTKVVTVTSEQAYTIDLEGWRYVKKLVIEAEGVGQDAMIEVWANDDLKGTIYAPGRDPQYTVTIGEASRRIVFRHIKGAPMRILSVKARVSAPIESPQSGVGRIEESQAAKISQRAIDLVRLSAKHCDAYNYATYALPVKISAGRTLAAANARGDLSEKVRSYLEALAAQMNHASPLTDRLLSDDGTYELGLKILVLQEELADLLQ